MQRERERERERERVYMYMADKNSDASEQLFSEFCMGIICIFSLFRYTTCTCNVASKTMTLCTLDDFKGAVRADENHLKYTMCT